MIRKKGIFSNIGIKILSVALAISLWVFVTYRGQAEIVIDVPLEFKNIPENLELLRQTARQVSLNISGHERFLKVLRPADVRVFVDLSNAKKGESVYYLDEDNVISPRIVKVIRVEPTSVKITFDESISRIVPVRAYIIGSPEAGYKIKSVDIMPSSVEIEGAKTEVERIALLRTEPVDITGIDSDIIQNVRLDTKGRNIRTKISEVTVKITIRRAGN